MARPEANSALSVKSSLPSAVRGGERVWKGNPAQHHAVAPKFIEVGAVFVGDKELPIGPECDGLGIDAGSAIDHARRGSGSVGRDEAGHIAPSFILQDRRSDNLGLEGFSVLSETQRHDSRTIGNGTVARTPVGNKKKEISCRIINDGRTDASDRVAIAITGIGREFSLSLDHGLAAGGREGH